MRRKVIDLAKKQTTTKKTATKQPAETPKEFKKKIKDEKAKLTSQQKELKSQEEYVRQLEKQREADIRKFREGLDKDTQTLLKKLLDKDPGVMKLREVVLVEGYEAKIEGQYKDEDEWCYFYKYTYAFVKIEWDKKRGVYINQRNPCSIIQYDIRWAREEMQHDLKTAIENTIAKNKVFVRANHRTDANFESIATLIAFFYRQQGDIDAAIAKTRKEFEKYASGKSKIYGSELYEYLYDMS